MKSSLKEIIVNSRGVTRPQLKAFIEAHEASKQRMEQSNFREEIRKILKSIK